MPLAGRRLFGALVSAHVISAHVIGAARPALAARAAYARASARADAALARSPGVVAATAIAKPDLDPREYRHVVLSNGLQVVLISDPAADKAAAALEVRAGHFDDPESMPGLAHFTEHMLFLGTEAYPEEGEYKAFLQRHGGQSNAFTGMEATGYHFSVGHAQAREATPVCVCVCEREREATATDFAPRDSPPRRPMPPRPRSCAARSIGSPPSSTRRCSAPNRARARCKRSTLSSAATYRKLPPHKEFDLYASADYE